MIFVLYEYTFVFWTLAHRNVFGRVARERRMLSIRSHVDVDVDVDVDINVNVDVDVDVDVDVQLLLTLGAQKVIGKSAAPPPSAGSDSPRQQQCKIAFFSKVGHPSIVRWNFY